MSLLKRQLEVEKVCQLLLGQVDVLFASGKWVDISGTNWLTIISIYQRLDKYVPLTVVVGDVQPKSRYKRFIVSFHLFIRLRVIFSHHFLRQGNCTIN